jgi:poly(hydroxyalkanoate) depolymerase family esterase
MLKSFTRLWLGSMQRAAKAQRRQQKKLLKSLLPKPAAKSATKPAAKRAAKVKRSPAKATVKSAAASAAKRAPAAARAPAPAPSARLPGKWMAFHYSSLSDAGILPARRMQYWVYLPASAPAGPLPMVVMLHGCEQTAAEFAQGTRMNALAEEKGFAVVYPQQSLRGHAHRCWHWYERSTQEGGDDVGLIAGIIAKVCAAYPIDRGRVYAAGLSAGAGMANILALCHPDKVAAVGLHSGPVYGAGQSKTSACGIWELGAAPKAGRSKSRWRG